MKTPQIYPCDLLPRDLLACDLLSVVVGVSPAGSGLRFDRVLFSAQRGGKRGTEKSHRSQIQSDILQYFRGDFLEAAIKCAKRSQK